MSREISATVGSLYLREPAELFHLYLTWALLCVILGGCVVAIRSNARIDAPPIPTLSITGSPSFQRVSQGIRVEAPDLVVRLNCEREPLIYLVGSNKVTFADLPARVKQELAARSDWNVYFDASGEVNVQDAVDVMNVIRKRESYGDNGQCFLAPKGFENNKKK